MHRDDRTIVVTWLGRGNMAGISPTARRTWSPEKCFFRTDALYESEVELPLRR